MPSFKVHTNSDERPSKWWEGKEIEKLVPRLPECHAMVGAMYKTISERGFDVTRYTIRIEDDKGWTTGSGSRSRDVAFVVEGETTALIALIQDPLFRGEWMGDDDTLDEAYAQIEE